MWVYGLDWAGPGQRQVADACECGNEPSGSVKCGEILQPGVEKPGRGGDQSPPHPTPIPSNVEFMKMFTFCIF